MQARTIEGTEPTQEEISNRLATAAARPVYVKLSQLPQEMVPFVRPPMIRAVAGCRHCHGTGNVGELKKGVLHQGKLIPGGTKIPCRCLMVDITKLRAYVTGLQAKAQADAEAVKRYESAKANGIDEAGARLEGWPEGGCPFDAPAQLAIAPTQESEEAEAQAKLAEATAQQAQS